MKNLIHNRREFLKFMGRTSGVALTAGTTGALSQLVTACSTLPNAGSPHVNAATGSAIGTTATTSNTALANTAAELDPLKLFTPLKPSHADELALVEGLQYRSLILWNTILNKRGETFGFNNDYTAFIPFSAHDGLLWVNHEYPSSFFINGLEPGAAKTKQHVDKERRAVGGSIIRIKRENINSNWQFILNDSYNRRLDATTRIPFAGAGNSSKVLGSSHAIGTLGNCAGGVTSWRTILTCEENYDNYYGEAAYAADGTRTLDTSVSVYKWQEHYQMPPEHYGWVVEVNPLNGRAKKLLGLGRFAHECATTTLANDGRTVVYMGDDKEDECVYKFISKKKGSLEDGDLYVANIEKGEWILLNRDKNPLLKTEFKTQIDMLIQTRKAARLVGGSLLNRPEDVEIDPVTKAVFIAATNNIPKGDYHGSILKIVEENNDPLSLKFTASTFLTGGPKAGFTCPDNFVFDKKGNLWMTTDISERNIGTSNYKFHGNNALYYIPMSGPKAGQALRVATGPVDSELTGPTFDPEYKTLFLSVQHPGASSARKDQITSRWPKGGNSLPHPAVVTISGPLLDKLMS